ncbi:MAG: hypothetical protein ACRDHW_02290 [Ktedonobacteraceae bacterium]
MNEREPVTSLSSAGATPEPSASEAQATEAAQEQESVTSYADIVIFCHPRNVRNLVQAFEVQIKHAEGELPMFVLWSGVTGLLRQGVVVLVWEGKVTPAFLHSLSIDHEIFDYVVYDYRWTQDEANQERGSEQEAQVDQDAERGQIARRQIV